MNLKFSFYYIIMSYLNIKCIICSQHFYIEKTSNKNSSCKNCNLSYVFNPESEKIEIDMKMYEKEYEKRNSENLDGCENWGVDG